MNTAQEDVASHRQGKSSRLEMGPEAPAQTHPRTPRLAKGRRPSAFGGDAKWKDLRSQARVAKKRSVPRALPSPQPVKLLGVPEPPPQATLLHTEGGDKFPGA